MRDVIPFAYLIPKDISEDERQDAFVALLENPPTTEDDARRTIRTAHHQTEYQQRKRPYQLNVDPGTEDEREAMPQLYPALALLPEADRLLITAHFVEGLTYEEMSIRFGVAHSTLNKRMPVVLSKIRKILSPNREISG